MSTIPAQSVTEIVPDVQAGRPATEVSLTRVGVQGVEKVVRVGGALYFAELKCFVDLNPQQAGVHMSRFEEVVNEAIDGAILNQTLRAEELAARIAEQVRERQQGLRAEVTIAARYPETVPTPVSKIATQEIYTLFGTAVASEQRHPDADRGRGPRDDRLSLRPGADRRQRPRAPGRRRLHRRRDRAYLRLGPRRHP